MEIRLSGLSADFVQESVLQMDSPSSVLEVRQLLISRYPELADYDLKIAVNSVLSASETLISETDDILVFGAYAGG